MRLALFDDYRLGVSTDDLDASEFADVTGVIDDHSSDPSSGWWRRLCRDFHELAPRLREAAESAPIVTLGRERLRAPALNPSKIVAAAANYADHVAEMAGVLERTIGSPSPEMLKFDFFLKAPSSVIGASESIVLPRAVVDRGEEIHHECELVAVIGTSARDVSAEVALDHVMGYTIGLDISVRSTADRSHRKSFDTFSPIGPWMTTPDEIPRAPDLRLQLRKNGELCQDVATGTMLVPMPELIARISQVMTLYPGDLIFTGAPAGVGPIAPGDQLEASLEGVGSMTVHVAQRR